MVIDDYGNEVNENIIYIERYAYVPVQLTTGWTWLKPYWAKSILYEPTLKRRSIAMRPVYIIGKEIRMSTREKEKDEVWRELSREVDNAGD